MLQILTCRQNEGPGNALLATLAYENLCEVFTAFGEKGGSAERVARQLVRGVRDYLVSDAALGSHLADQWALPLVLAVWQRGRCVVHLHGANRARLERPFETHLAALRVLVANGKALQPQWSAKCGVVRDVPHGVA